MLDWSADISGESAREYVHKYVFGAPLPPYVYFLRKEKDGSSHIKIGYSGAGDSNRVNAQKDGTLIAVIPGIEPNGKALHNHFSTAQSEAYRRSRDHFKHAAVKPYVDWLLSSHLSVSRMEDLWMVGPVDFGSIWHPDNMVSNKGTALWMDASPSVQDTCHTPEFMWRMVAKVLGRDYLDVCSDVAAYLRAPKNSRPKYFYTRYMDGLSLPWYGGVYVCPPFAEGEAYAEGGRRRSGPGAGLFTKKLFEEIDAGRVTEFICALSSASMHAKWFRPFFDRSGVLFSIPKERFGWHRPVSKSGSSKEYGAPQNGSVFLYFGPKEDRFRTVFDGTFHIGTFTSR